MSVSVWIKYWNQKNLIFTVLFSNTMWELLCAPNGNCKVEIQCHEDWVLLFPEVANAHLLRAVSWWLSTAVHLKMESCSNVCWSVWNQKHWTKWGSSEIFLHLSLLRLKKKIYCSKFSPSNSCQGAKIAVSWRTGKAMDTLKCLITEHCLLLYLKQNIMLIFLLEYSKFSLFVMRLLNEAYWQAAPK